MYPAGANAPLRGGRGRGKLEAAPAVSTNNITEPAWIVHKKVSDGPHIFIPLCPVPRRKRSFYEKADETALPGLRPASPGPVRLRARRPSGGAGGPGAPPSGAAESGALPERTVAGGPGPGGPGPAPGPEKRLGGPGRGRGDGDSFRGGLGVRHGSGGGGGRGEGGGGEKEEEQEEEESSLEESDESEEDEDEDEDEA